MTVASMPIESARARSMPLSAPCRPRKKLPPPTTTATSTPSAAVAARSAAMRWTVPWSSPWVRPPMSASPDSFTTTRRQPRGPTSRAAGGAVGAGSGEVIDTSASSRKAPPHSLRRDLCRFAGVVQRENGPSATSASILSAYGLAHASGILITSPRHRKAHRRTSHAYPVRLPSRRFRHGPSRERPGARRNRDL